MDRLQKFLIILLGLSLSIGIANADLQTTPTSLQSADETVLRVSASASATTLTLEPLYKYINGVKTKGCISTQAGFATLSDSTGRTEWISFSGYSCNATTFVTTLSSARRGLSPTAAAFTAGTGMAFDAGTKFKVIDYPIVYNYSLYKDIQNTLTGSGQLTGNNTHQATFRLNHVTTAQRDAFTYVGSGDLIFNNTVGAPQFRAGTSWYSFGSGANLINATETTGGKVELATLTDQRNRVETGDSGPVVLQAKNVTQSGGTTQAAYRATITSTNGLLSGSLLGTGTRSATTFLRGDQTYARPSASGATVSFAATVKAKIPSLSSTSFAAIDGVNLTTAPTFSVGDIVMLEFHGSVYRSASNPVVAYVDFQVGNNPISGTSSGSIAQHFSNAGGEPDYNVSFTKFIQVQTGGTLTIQPIYRVNTAGGATVQFQNNTGFSVMKVH